MSLQTPKTKAEWRAYVRQYDGVTLRSQTISTNKAKFIQVLLDEGYTPAEVKEIILIFVQRCCEVGMEPPRGGYFDLKRMAAIDPFCLERMKANIPSDEDPNDRYMDLRTEMDDLDEELEKLELDED